MNIKMRILGQMARLLSTYTVLIKSHPYGPLKAMCFMSIIFIIQKTMNKPNSDKKRHIIIEATTHHS